MSALAFDVLDCVSFDKDPERCAAALVVFDSRMADLEVLSGALLPGGMPHWVADDEDGLTSITQ